MVSSRPFSIHAFCFISLGDNRRLVSALSKVSTFPVLHLSMGPVASLVLSNTYAMLWGFHFPTFVIPQPPIPIVSLFVPGSGKLPELSNVGEKRPLYYYLANVRLEENADCYQEGANILLRGGP